MVYGLNVKPVHGYYVEVDALDGDIKKIEVVDPTPDGGLPFIPTIQPAYTMGRPVKTDFVPRKMQWGDQHGHPIPDFDNGLILNVSERAKALLEEFEPGVHQFVPVTYFTRAGQPLEQRYFLIVCNRLDTVDREHSRMRLAKEVMWTPDGVDDPKIILNRAQIGGAHLWCDKHMRWGPYVSDELADVLQSQEMTGLGWNEAGLETV